MDLTARFDISQPAVSQHELELRHSPEKVWRALTDPSLLSEWLLPAFGLKLEVGSAFTLYRARSVSRKEQGLVVQSREQR